MSVLVWQQLCLGEIAFILQLTYRMLPAEGEQGGHAIVLTLRIAALGRSWPQIVVSVGSSATSPVGSGGRLPERKRLASAWAQHDGGNAALGREFCLRGMAASCGWCA